MTKLLAQTSYETFRSKPLYSPSSKQNIPRRVDFWEAWKRNAGLTVKGPGCYFSPHYFKEIPCKHNLKHKGSLLEGLGNRLSKQRRQGLESGSSCGDRMKWLSHVIHSQEAGPGAHLAPSSFSIQSGTYHPPPALHPPLMEWCCPCLEWVSPPP